MAAHMVPQRARRSRAQLYGASLDTIERLTSIVCLDDLSTELARAFFPYGIEHFVVAGLPNPRERFEKVVVLKYWSADWFEVYTNEQFARHDPVIRKCRSTTMPFEWHEAPFDRDREPATQRLMETAADFGLVRGFSIPVHTPNGYEACFSVSGAKPEFDVASKAALHLLALYAFESINRLNQPATPGNPLSSREREVLTWVAVGKTHADIAEILSLTERTVTAHAVNATHKLGAANRTHAVVRAMQAKYIRV